MEFGQRGDVQSGFLLIQARIIVIFAGLTADARILIDKARIECQSHKLTVEDPVSMEYIARYVAGIMQVSCRIATQFLHLLLHTFVVLFQKYTQSRGRRPFGLSVLMAGFDFDGSPHLYLSDPSGSYYEWKVRQPVWFVGSFSKNCTAFNSARWSKIRSVQLL